MSPERGIDAGRVLAASGVPDVFCGKTTERLARQQLTVSRKKLMLAYKMAFEALAIKAADQAG